jgi:hypothetical protein
MLSALAANANAFVRRGFLYVPATLLAAPQARLTGKK